MTQIFYCSLIVYLLWQFASRISGMRFCESSAKDNFNVDEIFLKLVDDILAKVGYRKSAVILQWKSSCTPQKPL